MISSIKDLLNTDDTVESDNCIQHVLPNGSAIRAYYDTAFLPGDGIKIVTSSISFHGIFVTDDLSKVKFLFDSFIKDHSVKLPAYSTRDYINSLNSHSELKCAQTALLSLIDRVRTTELEDFCSVLNSPKSYALVNYEASKMSKKVCRFIELAYSRIAENGEYVLRSTNESIDDRTFVSYAKALYYVNRKPPANKSLILVRSTKSETELMRYDSSSDRWMLI